MTNLELQHMLIRLKEGIDAMSPVETPEEVTKRQHREVLVSIGVYTTLVGLFVFILYCSAPGI